MIELRIPTQEATALDGLLRSLDILTHPATPEQARIALLHGFYMSQALRSFSDRLQAELDDLKRIQDEVLAKEETNANG